MKTSLKREENSQAVSESAEISIQEKPRKNMPKHMLIKLTKLKNKENTLKAAKEKQ